MGLLGRGKWLNRLNDKHKAAICEAYRQMRSIGKVERYLRATMGSGPSHSVITRILKSADVELNPVGWPPQYRVKKESCQSPESSCLTGTQNPAR